jgi:hypothetical protein
MTAKHHIVRIAAVLAALALAAPAFADPPQLRADSPATAVAPDGWAVQFQTTGSGAAAHPDNGPRYVGPRLAADPSGNGAGLDLGVAILGAVAVAAGLATVTALAQRGRAHRPNATKA